MQKRFKMKVAKRSSLRPQKQTKRKKIVSHAKSLVAYLKSDGYLFAPLFSNFRQQTQTHPPSDSESSKDGQISVSGFEELGMERVNNRERRMSEKVKEYLESDSHMYGPMISPSKLGSSIQVAEAGKLQIANLVTVDISTSTTTVMRKESDSNNNYRDLRSEIADQTLHKRRISSPKRPVVILEGQRNGLNRQTNPPLAEENMVKSDQRESYI